MDKLDKLKDEMELDGASSEMEMEDVLKEQNSAMCLVNDLESQEPVR